MLSNLKKRKAKNHMGNDYNILLEEESSSSEGLNKIWRILSIPIILILISTLACGNIFQLFVPSDEAITESTATPTPLPAIPVMPGEDNPNEPVYVTGDIPYTSPFFLNTIHQPFVLLEDQAGFVNRDRDFHFPINAQIIGPVIIHDDDSLTYSLNLPMTPQGTLVDVDHNPAEGEGVQIFAIAYWSNTWGDTFLEERDGTGWSTAYASTITDPANEDEITGGTLIVWAPDDEQAFPSGFGADGLLFTEDDPVAKIPAGYNIIVMDAEPFQVYKSQQPVITLNEGVVAVNNFTEMDYAQAFSALFDKVSREYPFTEEKGIDWEALKAEFSPRFEAANNEEDFYKALKDFTMQIPDGHVNVTLNADVFYEKYGGGFGMMVDQLSDGRVIVTDILVDSPADDAGIEIGAEIIAWDDKLVNEVIEQTVPFFGPYSTESTKRVNQVNFFMRVKPDQTVEIRFKNPGEANPQQTSLRAEVEYDTLLRSFPNADLTEVSLPLDGEIFEDTRIGYLRISTFSDDYQLMARLWDHYIQGFIDEEVEGLIIDLRQNGGGAMGVAMDFAGYFFDEDIPLYQSYYYSERTGGFEKMPSTTDIEPAPKYFEGDVVVLVSPDCVSACEGFAYAMQYDGRSTIIGHYPTAGAFGEVGRGQYELPDDIKMQFPTGLPESLEDGSVVIEGVGVVPDITVPVTIESALGELDALLEEAIEVILE
jgi:C-terminal processing protease CtpA/Prc